MTSFYEDSLLNNIINDTVPSCIEIRSASTDDKGISLFATKFFSRGETLYEGKQIIIPNKYKEFTLITDQGTFSLNTETHSVQINETERGLYLFDSFMNHSCNPSTISKSLDLYRYQQVAFRDIHPGDEITCDYNLFEYDCGGKTIETCLCNDISCIKRVAGFRYLSKEHQQSRLEQMDSSVLEAMAADSSNNFFYFPESDLKCPLDRVRIDMHTDPNERSSSYKMIATRDYSKGEVIYSNQSLLVPHDCNIVVVLNNKRIWLENLVHTINRGNGQREFYLFDSFQNHSCEPNTAMHYSPRNTTAQEMDIDVPLSYELVALEDITAEQELTSDYETFDEKLDGTCFECECGSSACRKFIRG